MRQATGIGVAAAFAAAASMLFTGCAGNGAGLDANGQPLVPGESSGPLTADFDSIQAHVFTPICTVCHAGANAPHGLRLDAADSYNLLVGVPSVEVPSILRVKPGDPDNSYLIQKLEGHAAVGARMPFGGPYLSSDVVAVIRQWITNGAPPSSATAMPAAFAMLTVAPALGDVLSEPPALVVIGFTHELDATRIDSESVRIERSAMDGGDAAAEIVPARAMVSFANPRALILRPLQPLNAGHYRVVMRTASGSGVTDIGGAALHSTDSGEALITTFDVEVAP
jgi:hypothetical protein